MPHFLVVMGGTAAAVLTLSEVRTRTKLIKVGATAALTYFLMTWATGLWQDQPLDLIRSDSFWRAGWGLMAGFFLGGSLPFIENALGIVTGISLLELGDNTHPLLQELVRRAPGTHNHSITVGAIAESAAERIGADALLVRIGAYFHDIGKMLKPHYFVENQVGPTSRHAKLAPAMSTLIIIGHVKDGVDLGRQHHLPEPIIDLIEQHHGTTLVEYFYHEANRRNGTNPDASPVSESAYRYPGPKPQTKEAAILMVADAVESASRSLSDPTPSRLEGLVTRPDRQAPARRPVRRVRAHPARNRRDPRQPDQVADRHLPRPGQVPRTPDGMRRAWDVNRPVDPGTLARWKKHPHSSAGPPSEHRSCSPRSKSRSAIHKAIFGSNPPPSITWYAWCWPPRIVRERRFRSPWSIMRRFTRSTRLIWGTTGRRTSSLSPWRTPTNRCWPENWSSRPRWLAIRARELGVEPRDELALYVVHGLLHLCGYDDRDDSARRRMRAA